MCRIGLKLGLEFTNQSGGIAGYLTSGLDCGAHGMGVID